MTVPTTRDEALLLQARIDSDRAQMESLTASIGALYAAQKIVHERLTDNLARLRSYQAQHYGDLGQQAQPTRAASA